MELNWQEMLFQFLGGLGIFLFAIKYMGDGLQKAAGDRLRSLLDKYTTNPFMGVVIGIVVTVLIQSSSATTVIIVGLVSAGFMTLKQAIGVIMGANIGTTITAFIIGFDIGGNALPIMAIGAFLLFFFKNNKIQHIGEVIFGLGGLFLGLNFMSEGMKPLSEVATFFDLALFISNTPIYGVIAGTVLTVIVQSSSATVAVLQGLYAENLISLEGSLPILFGDNIGTTVTAVLASLGASVAAKRAAATHVLFNVIGTIIFLIFLTPFTIYVEWISNAFDLEHKMQIAFAHGTFNITNTIIQLPLIGAWALLVTKMIPGEDVSLKYKPKHLDVHFIEQSPTIAIGQAKEEILRMGALSIQGLQTTYSYLMTNNKKDAEIGYRLEDALNNLDKKITDYLIQISSEPLSKQDSTRHNSLLDTVRDVERIGDHFENIIELIEYREVNQLILTEEALKDVSDMFKLTISTVTNALESFDTSNSELAKKVSEQENMIDKMERRFRKNHIVRVNEGLCSAQVGILFVDILSNLERIGDHASNIAEGVLGKRV